MKDFNAKDANKLANSKVDVRPILKKIKKAANRGEFSTTFSNLSGDEIDRLCSLSYIVVVESEELETVYRVSWA